MLWLKNYWWLILILLISIILNAIKELYQLDYKSYLKNKPQLPLNREGNTKLDNNKDSKVKYDRNSLIS
ncbi:hypothetical protein [Candidatus Fukatsuia anoeciicola]